MITLVSGISHSAWVQQCAQQNQSESDRHRIPTTHVHTEEASRAVTNTSHQVRTPRFAPLCLPQTNVAGCYWLWLEDIARKSSQTAPGWIPAQLHTERYCDTHHTAFTLPVHPRSDTLERTNAYGVGTCWGNR